MTKPDISTSASKAYTQPNIIVLFRKKLISKENNNEMFLYTHDVCII